MVGSMGPRVLAATLPYVDAWNVWYTEFGNRPDRFASLSTEVSEVARRAGRDPAEIRRSACVRVVLDRRAAERSIEDGVRPLEGGVQAIASGLREFADAGADEAILVVTPITEASILELAEAVAIARANGQGRLSP